MKNFGLKFGEKLTKNEMKNIMGGRMEDESGYCIFCVDGQAENLTCYGDISDCASYAAAILNNEGAEGYTCSDGASGGDMSSCPL